MLSTNPGEVQRGEVVATKIGWGPRELHSRARGRPTTLESNPDTQLRVGNLAERPSSKAQQIKHSSLASRWQANGECSDLGYSPASHRAILSHTPAGQRSR